MLSVVVRVVDQQDNAEEREKQHRPPSLSWATDARTNNTQTTRPATATCLPTINSMLQFGHNHSIRRGNCPASAICTDSVRYINDTNECPKRMAETSYEVSTVKRIPAVLKSYTRITASNKAIRMMISMMMHHPDFVSITSY